MLTFEKSMQCGRSEEHIFARSQSKRYSTHAALILGQLGTVLYSYRAEADITILAKTLASPQRSQ